MKVSFLKSTINYDHLTIVKTISQHTIEPFSIEMYYSTSKSEKLRLWIAAELDSNDSIC